MCVMSMVLDHYREKWAPLVPVQPLPPPTYPFPLFPVAPEPPVHVPLVSQEEVQELRRLLDRARKYDKEHAQPDCELDEKRKAIKRIAEELGVEINFV